MSDWAAKRSKTLSAVRKISLMIRHPNACHAVMSSGLVEVILSDDDDDDDDGKEKEN